jgi:hypothetical protein
MSIKVMRGDIEFHFKIIEEEPPKWVVYLDGTGSAKGKAPMSGEKRAVYSSSRGEHGPSKGLAGSRHGKLAEGEQTGSPGL